MPSPMAARPTRFHTTSRKARFGPSPVLMNFSMTPTMTPTTTPAMVSCHQFSPQPPDDETKGEGQGRELERNVEDPLRRALSFERVSDEADPPKNGEYREEIPADLLVDGPIGDQDYHRDNRNSPSPGQRRQWQSFHPAALLSKALILPSLRRYVPLVLAQQQRGPFLRFFQRVEAIRGQPHSGAADRAYH